MQKLDTNWSAIMREAIARKVRSEAETNRMEALPINERLRRKAPEGWDSTKVNMVWRDRRR